MAPNERHRKFCRSLKLLALALTLACVEQQSVVLGFPTITSLTKDQIVDIGDTLELKCNMADIGNNVFGWSRIDFGNSIAGTGFTTPIARGLQLDVPGTSKFLPSFDPRLSQYTLRVRQVSENDAGVYQCSISTGMTSPVYARTNVFVRIPPTISDNSTRSVITSVGSDIQLQCFATGYPQPRINWRRNKNLLIPINGGAAIYRGNTLTLTNVSKEDRGTYYCVADNGVSPGARRSMSVEIEFKPVVKVAQPRYEQALQYDVYLHCSIEAFPSPSIMWLKDNQELITNQHYNITIFDTSSETSHTTIEVKKIEKRQYGAYICRAANKFGFTEAEVYLDETPNVICPPACGRESYFPSGGATKSLFARSQSHFLLIVLASLIVFLATAKYQRD